MLLITLLLSACGFHLRGAVQVSEELKPMQVQDAKTPTRIFPELSHALRNRGVVLSEASEQAHALLTLHEEVVGQNVLTVAVGGDVQEFRLTYSIKYTLRDKSGSEVLKNDNISLQRDLRFDKNAVLAKSSEAEQLQREMVRDAVQQLLRRIQDVGKAG